MTSGTTEAGRRSMPFGARSRLSSLGGDGLGRTGRWGPGGGLDDPVEPASECELEATPHLPVRLALSRALDLVGARLLVAAQPRDRDGVQRPVEVAVPAAVEPVPDALPAAGLQWGGAGERGERGLTAHPPRMRPGDEQLRGDDGPDAGLGEAGPAG